MERVAAQIAGALASSRSHAHALVSERAKSAMEAEKRKLEVLEEQRAQFLSTVSHELRTPLTSLVAFADILAKNRDFNLTERQLNQITVMQRSSRTLELLINDLLDVSRLDAGTFTLSIEEFDVCELIGEISAAFAPTAQQKSQSLNVDTGQRSIWINGDRDRIAQVITNLLNNAAKYSPMDSGINLSVTRDNSILSCTVHDDGIGMSVEDQKSLFTPFFRAANAETQSEAGTGLGLVIVKSIVELHGGNISFQSKKGVGSTARVTFPDCTDQPSQEYVDAQKAPAEPVALASRLE